MKVDEAGKSIRVENDKLIWNADEAGDNHWSLSADTPMRKDAGQLSDEEKIEKIAPLFQQIMETLGLDLSDDSLNGTPRRVAKMYVNEIFRGLNPNNRPEITLFENSYRYDRMLIEKNISVNSNCEHHFVPIVGKAHIAYLSSGKVIGLSKLNRLVDYYARRPQVQERLTVQIGQSLQKILQTDDLAVVIDARHFCVSSRGIKDPDASTITSFYGGQFSNDPARSEFLNYLNLSAH